MPGGSITRDAVVQLYQAVSTEYNSTPLATDEGWIHSPTEFGLQEMIALAKYLPQNGVLVDIGTGRGIGARFGRKLGCRVISVDSPDAGGGRQLRTSRPLASSVTSATCCTSRYR